MITVGVVLSLLMLLLLLQRCSGYVENSAMNGPWIVDPSRDSGSLDALLALAGVGTAATRPAIVAATVDENLALEASVFTVDTNTFPGSAGPPTHSLYRLGSATDEDDPWLGAVQTRHYTDYNLTQVQVVKTRQSDLSTLTVARQLASNDTQVLVYSLNFTLYSSGSSYATCVRYYVRRT